MHRKLPSWHQIQHCTGAPWPNGKLSNKCRALRGRHFLIQGVDHRQGENSFLHSLFHMLCAKLHTLSPATAAPLPLRASSGRVGAEAVLCSFLLVRRQIPQLLRPLRIGPSYGCPQSLQELVPALQLDRACLVQALPQDRPSVFNGVEIL